MLSWSAGAVLTGVDATVVRVECDLGNGLPAFTVVGLPDVSVQEARERVRAAILHSGEPFPMCRITVNLAPSDVRKQGPSLDLVLAVCLLVAQQRAPQQGLEGRMFIGELGLSGKVHAVRGALASAEAARRAGMKQVVCPAANAGEAALAGLPVVPVESLREAMDVIRGRGPDAVLADPAGMLDDPVHRGLCLEQIR
ncbi:MAG TPA: magnesium chelatase domain-containing protein, partial [Actinomycetota bacterium]|nr:magnesium chelatase domain-containing protein [Actinomycetota bacterium]